MLIYEKVEKYLIPAVCVLLVLLGFFAWGYNVGKKHATVVTNTVTKEIQLPAEVKTETKTEVVYVPKEVEADTGQVEKADVEANIGKQEIHVKVNGQEQTIKKADSEKYVFDKNKLQLNQNSTATVDIKVPVVDKTKRWSIGVGYGNHGIAGKVDFPIGKQNRVGGWVAGDKQTVMGGLTFNLDK